MKFLEVVNKIEKSIIWLVNYFLWFSVVYCGVCSCASDTICENEWLEIVVICVFGYYYIKKALIKIFGIWKG